MPAARTRPSSPLIAEIGPNLAPIPIVAICTPGHDHEPGLHLRTEGTELYAQAFGDWRVLSACALEGALSAFLDRAADARRVRFDLSDLTALDTLGAWLVERTRRDLTTAERTVEVTGAQPQHEMLLKEVAHHTVAPPVARTMDGPIKLLADLGQTVLDRAQDFWRVIGLLGEVVAVAARLAFRAQEIRGTSFVHQLEQIAFRGVPVIALISFLVGGIVAQQGIFQLNRFGASTYVVDLIGILSLRELGVLLTAIMVAGRSGSAFTAELGSMRMREEIDALRIIGLNPTAVLVLPRVLALVVGLPMLTFLADLAALYGGGLVAWLYGGISPDAFLARLQEAIGVNTFLVGQIKAPFMAAMIGIIACSEGFAVRGSAESLGRHVTASVVKAIFMVIVMDGLFAVFFAAIDY